MKKFFFVKIPVSRFLAIVVLCIVSIVAIDAIADHNVRNKPENNDLHASNVVPGGPGVAVGPGYRAPLREAPRELHLQTQK